MFDKFSDGISNTRLVPQTCQFDTREALGSLWRRDEFGNSIGGQHAWAAQVSFLQGGHSRGEQLPILDVVI
jgi:hypothetical protein